MGIGWFITYPMSCVKHNTVKYLLMLTNLSSSGRSIWCLAGDMFWHKKHKKVGCRPTNSIPRPASLNYVHVLIIGRLRTCTIPLEPSNRAKTMVAGTYFGEFDE